MSPPSLALGVAMGSMSMLFGASLIGSFITRAQNPAWGTGMPGLPRGLWGSTLLIGLVSFAFVRALAAARRNHFEGLERWLWLATAAAVSFVGVQVFNWRAILGAHGSVALKTLYVFTFYMLTGLHALHVAFGFIPLGVVLRKAHLRQYSSSRNEGLRLCRRYWDYLAIVWLVLLTALYFGSLGR
ncbi:MAG TPA: cytochrome c oxidase subunit 3 [Polyangiaceae bacterium]|nr:cytochrome c oxidase subunit 3 [Polyangiaceae bacterium]